MGRYTVPGLDADTGAKVAQLLQGRLTATIDLQLTLKHVHWNVVGPNFASVHEMLDPWVDATRQMSDALAERIATLGAEPVGTPGFVAHHRTWEEYSLNRADASRHLAELDSVYSGVIGDHRAAIHELEDLDLVSQDMLIGQAEKLEMQQWFVRAHLDDGRG
ncbi:DNA starvation/stationary phase protection protein [Egibacter rhizosphaerae]|uniref:DNA starvation/stationary phase protection protein n=1 Tax=Egibacter rhizosphaerae TaxID=1670831 RepID=A0A411YAM9_9ACTN|nr:DNA starvation/stationary phase protection protein [Egibacter rhizosphaerae]QBI18256.1 DNA starvation/stationary phase protection protein [Egibacter rhizosphaerae]